MDGYESYYISQSLRPFRSGVILAIVLYSVFGVLDFYSAPDSYQKIWGVRCLVVSIMAVVWYLSYSDKLFRYFTALTCFCALTVSFGILAMLCVLSAEELAIHEYHNGLVLCLFGASTIFRLRTRHASIVNVVVVLSYGLIAYFRLGLFTVDHLAKLLNNVFFITSSAIMGMVYMGSLEKVLRKNCLNDKLIREEKNRLAKVKIDLEISDSIKNKLLAIISHDIRGPLSSIKGLLLLCQFKRITQPEFDVHLKKVIGAVDNTALLLENLLCWSTLENQSKNSGSEVDIRTIVNDIFSLFEEPARRKNNNLINSVDPKTVVRADHSIIRLIIRNFIANAVKFTENGLITVRTDAINGHHIRISVKDTGKGMSQDVKDKLFNWSVKHSSEGTSGEKGTGIGLLICNDFAERIKGRISFDTTVGLGTTFSLVLPASQSQKAVMED